MDREEAIQILDKMPLCAECDSSNMPYPCTDCGDAFLLAMEALKQPEIIRCKDCKHGRVFAENCVACDITEYPAHDADWFCADGRKRDDME